MGSTSLPIPKARGVSINTISDIGRRVILTESQALAMMGEAIGAEFAAAVELLASIEGRIVVTGMGKSGHVARKIAATFASTGAPAQFVPPAEASHGDLGMITRDDALLALSNSGDTAELGDTMAHAARLQVPLIAITSRAPSSLSTAATVTLLLPKAPEAGVLKLAPTTSTTLTMAMGDALAVALLETRGFSSADFHALHPGGRLGQQLKRVADIMHRDPPIVPTDTARGDALVTMTAASFGCVGVVNEHARLVGIVTDGDLRRNMSSDLLASTAGAIMTGEPKVIRANALAAEALAIMNERSITSLFVTDPDEADDHPKAIGIVHVHDCLRAGVT